MTSSVFRTLPQWLAAPAVLFLAMACAQAADLNIVFLDEQSAVLDTERAQVFRKELEEELQSELDQVKQLNDDLQALQEQITRDGEIMSKEERQRLINEARSKGVRGENLAESIREIQQQRVKLLFQELGDDLTSVVNDIIADYEYDAVLRLAPQSVIYVQQKHDITSKVTERLNAKLAQK